MTETAAEAPDGDARAGHSPVELAAVELLSLISMRRNAATDRARILLGLPGDGPDSPVTLAGTGSLLVRGLARVHRGRLVPLGPAQDIASVLVNAVAWSEALGTAGDAAAVTAVVRSRAATVLFERAPYDVWRIRPISQHDPLPEIGVAFVASAFDTLSARPFTGSVRVIDADATMRTAVARVTADGSWTLAAGPGGDIPAGDPTAPDPTFRMLAASLA